MSEIADKLAAALASAQLTLPKVHQVANPQDATGCCRAINTAIRKGELDSVDVWACPQCSMEWRPELVEGIRVWQAHPIFMLWK